MLGLILHTSDTTYTTITYNKCKSANANNT